jgi:CheY-like chemotaxis protein
MGILNDVLDLAKIEAGKMTLADEHFSFSAMLQPVIAPVIQQCKAKGVQFVCIVASDFPDMVIGDAMRLRQIVINLLSNACKFTREGKVELDASAEKVAGERFSLVLHVRDTGIGIAPDEIHRIFDAFEQADRSDSRRYGGTGLGLAICLKIARLMGGEIEVSSQLDHGSDFCVRLPMRRVPVIAPLPIGPIPPPERVVREDVASRPLKILAAEDNRVNRLLLGKILEKAGHHAVFAENGAEAIRLWENGKFDLVLMDLQMPVMDGVEAAQEIRRREAGNSAHTPIIAVTARAMHEDRDLTVAAGMDGYVSKPYSAEDILAAIRKVLHQPNRGAAR